MNQCVACIRTTAIDIQKCRWDRAQENVINYPEMAIKGVPFEMYATILISTTVKSTMELLGCTDLNLPLSENLYI